MRGPYAPPSTPPATGPISVPTVANDIAVPSTRPRLWGGVPSDSQAMPAVHDTADDSPWPMRAAISGQNPPAKPHPNVATASSATPKIVRRRAPTRAARYPTGTDPTSTAPL